MQFVIILRQYRSLVENVARLRSGRTDVQAFMSLISNLLLTHHDKITEPRDKLDRLDEIKITNGANLQRKGTCELFARREKRLTMLIFLYSRSVEEGRSNVEYNV